MVAINEESSYMKSYPRDTLITGITGFTGFTGFPASSSPGRKSPHARKGDEKCGLRSSKASQASHFLGEINKKILNKFFTE